MKGIEMTNHDLELQSNARLFKMAELKGRIRNMEEAYNAKCQRSFIYGIIAGACIVAIVWMLNV